MSAVEQPDEEAGCRLEQSVKVYLTWDVEKQTWVVDPVIWQTDDTGDPYPLDGLVDGVDVQCEHEPDDPEHLKQLEAARRAHLPQPHLIARMIEEAKPW